MLYNKVLAFFVSQLNPYQDFNESKHQDDANIMT